MLTGFGAAYGTAKSGVGIASMGVMRPELVMKSIIPVVMAGVLGIYGLIIAVIISTGSKLLLSQECILQYRLIELILKPFFSLSPGSLLDSPLCLKALAANVLDCAELKHKHVTGLLLEQF